MTGRTSADLADILVAQRTASMPRSPWRALTAAELRKLAGPFLADFARQGIAERDGNGAYRPTVGALAVLGELEDWPSMAPRAAISDTPTQAECARVRCVVCGNPMKRKPTGRPRQVCSNRCRQFAYRQRCSVWAVAA